MAIDVFQQLEEQAKVRLQTNPLPDLDQVLFAYAPVFRIVEYQISQFSPLLHKMDVCKPSDSLAESRHSEQVAQHDPRIVEAERLVEIAH